MAAINSCGGCDRRWNSTSEAHCATCHCHFSTVANFDRHRVNGTCADPATLTDRHGQPILRPVERPGGPTWVGGTPSPFTAPQPVPATLESTPEEN